MKQIRPAAVCRGFTLMEVLIVVAIFAVIAALSLGALTQYLNTSERLRDNYADLESLQRAFLILDRDMRYMVNRTSRNQFGDTEDAFLIDNLNGEPGEKIRLTSHHPDYRSPDAGRMERVAWAVEDNRLIRISWPVLDQGSESESIYRVVLDEVDELRVQQYNWSDQFGLQLSNSYDPESEIPAGVELVLQLKDGRTFTRVYDLANGS